MEIDGRKDFYNPKSLFIELIGTFAITMLAHLTTINYLLGLTKSYTSVVLCVGISYTLWSWLCRNRSGGHFNPAISLAFVKCKQIPMGACILYISAQIIGAIFATGFVYTIIGPDI